MPLDLPRIFSVDDHLVEPPELWTDRLPKNFQEIGPRIKRELRPSRVAYGLTDKAGQLTKEGDETRWCDVWYYENVAIPLDRGVAAVGFDESEVDLIATTYDEIRPGCFRQDARLADMDMNGVETSVCYPNTFVRFAGQRFLEAEDKDLALLCVRAYNDFLIEEWSGGSNNRLISACIVPLWDVDLAVAEAKRVASRGARVVSFPELPTFIGLPSIFSGYWDPFFYACADQNLILAMHIGSASYQLTTSTDAPISVVGIMGFASAMMSLVDWLVSAKLETFPNLRLLFAECQIGWIPYILERADRFMNSEWGVTQDLRSSLTMLPSEYFRRQVYVCFFDDAHGLRSIEEIGLDNVCFETDYPHPDSTWPNSLDKARQLCSALSPEQAAKVVRDNAVTLFSSS